MVSPAVASDSTLTAASARFALNFTACSCLLTLASVSRPSMRWPIRSA